MAAETGFMIDGTLYEVPSLDSFTMDDAQILYDYSGLTLEDFVPAEGQDPDEENAELSGKLRNPGFVRALMHVAYQRANPKVSPQRVKAMIGSASLIGALEHLADDEPEGDAVPPAVTTEHDGSSPRSSVGSNGSSGAASTPSSDAPDVLPVPTGTIRSVTSFTSDPASSAA